MEEDPHFLLKLVYLSSPLIFAAVGWSGWWAVKLYRLHNAKRG